MDNLKIDGNLTAIIMYIKGNINIKRILTPLKLSQCIIASYSNTKMQVAILSQYSRDKLLLKKATCRSIFTVFTMHFDIKI